MRGSKYELKFDYQGKPINEDEIRQVLRRGQPGPGETVGNVIAAASNAAVNTAAGSASMNIISQGSHQVDNDMQSNSNMSHQMSKD